VQFVENVEFVKREVQHELGAIIHIGLNRKRMEAYGKEAQFN